MKLRTLGGRAACIAMLAGLAACGGHIEGVGPNAAAISPQTFIVGGTVSGLAAGSQIVLNISGNSNNASASGTLTLNANARYTFDVPVQANGSYSVAITGQPTGQTCSVSRYSGSGLTADVLNVDITCSTLSYTLAGSVSGLASGAQLTLNNNGADALIVNADGGFTFAKPVPYNGSYAVTTASQPTGQTCTVSNQSGAGMTANVSNVSVACSTDAFTIAGTLTGLASGAQLTLNNNAADPLTLNADGSFSFAAPVAYNGGYAVTVGTQPTGQTCSVSNLSGSGIKANVSNVAVTCSTNTFVISGTVSGLTSGLQVTLNDNASDPVTVGLNGNFAFAVAVPYNGSYAVTVGTQPNGLICGVSNGASSGVTANVTNVSVNCVAAPVFAYTVNYNDNTVSQFRVGAGGVLTPLTVSTVATGPGPYAIAIDTTGHFAYVVNSGANSVSQYEIGSDGTLVPMSTAEVATGPFPYAIVIDPSNRYVYVMNIDDDTISQFRIGANGSLMPMVPAFVAAAGTSTMMTDPMGHYLYVSLGNTVLPYAIGASGALVPLDVGASATGNVPVSITFDPSGSHAYIPSEFDAKISQYTVGADGALTSMAPSFVGGGSFPFMFILDGTGRYGYLVNSGDNSISQYSRGAGGMLQALSVQTVATGSEPVAMAIDPNNQFAYVVNDIGNSISQFSIGADGGLVSIGTIATGSDPLAIALTKGH